MNSATFDDAATCLILMVADSALEAVAVEAQATAERRILLDPRLGDFCEFGTAAVDPASGPTEIAQGLVSAVLAVLANADLNEGRLVASWTFVASTPQLADRLVEGFLSEPALRIMPAQQVSVSVAGTDASGPGWMQVTGADALQSQLPQIVRSSAQAAFTSWADDLQAGAAPSTLVAALMGTLTQAVAEPAAVAQQVVENDTSASFPFAPSLAAVEADARPQESSAPGVTTSGDRAEGNASGAIPTQAMFEEQPDDSEPAEAVAEADEAVPTARSVVRAHKMPRLLQRRQSEPEEKAETADPVVETQMLTFVALDEASQPGVDKRVARALDQIALGVAATPSVAAVGHVMSGPPPWDLLQPLGRRFSRFGGLLDLAEVLFHLHAKLHVLPRRHPHLPLTKPLVLLITDVPPRDDALTTAAYEALTADAEVLWLLLEGSSALVAPAYGTGGQSVLSAGDDIVDRVSERLGRLQAVAPGS